MYDIEVQEFRSQLQEMKSKLDKIEQSSDKMDKHIDFIESVYATLKAPIDYIVGTYNKLLKS